MKATVVWINIIHSFLFLEDKFDVCWWFRSNMKLTFALDISKFNSCLFELFLFLSLDFYLFLLLFFFLRYLLTCCLIPYIFIRWLLFGRKLNLGLPQFTDWLGTTFDLIMRLRMHAFDSISRLFILFPYMILSLTIRCCITFLIIII